MKNLERKDILNVKKHTKNKSVFNNSQLVLNILYDTSIKYKNNKSSCFFHKFVLPSCKLLAIMRLT